MLPANVCQVHWIPILISFVITNFLFIHISSANIMSISYNSATKIGGENSNSLNTNLGLHSYKNN